MVSASARMEAEFSVGIHGRFATLIGYYQGLDEEKKLSSSSFSLFSP
jgi:hypothetical protein